MRVMEVLDVGVSIDVHEEHGILLYLVLRAKICGINIFKHQHRKGAKSR